MPSAVAGALERNPSALCFLLMLVASEAAALAPPLGSLLGSLSLPGSGQLVVVAGGGPQALTPTPLTGLPITIPIEIGVPLPQQHLGLGIGADLLAGVTPA